MKTWSLIFMTINLQFKTTFTIWNPHLLCVSKRLILDQNENILVVATSTNRRDSYEYRASSSSQPGIYEYGSSSSSQPQVWLRASKLATAIGYEYRLAINYPLASYYCPPGHSYKLTVVVFSFSFLVRLRPSLGVSRHWWGRNPPQCATKSYLRYITKNRT